MTRPFTIHFLPGGLADGEEEGLQPGKVPHQLEDAEDLGHAHQPHNLARLPDDVELCVCRVEGPAMFQHPLEGLVLIVASGLRSAPLAYA